ncbi:pentapeptide repeat-containing protein [Nonomuraea sp. NPDC050022]|uniref:pentapeptide repeat-containing protein n=1 Tax=unclassified Nonomuraea TaxID=2593643 RepID=UPI0033DEADE8
MRNANLRGALLTYGDLREATLIGAVLTGASLKRVVFDEYETTIGPTASTPPSSDLHGYVAPAYPYQNLRGVRCPVGDR